MFKKSKTKKIDVTASVEITEREPFPETRLRPYEKLCFRYDITMDYLDFRDNKEGLKAAIAAKIARKMDEYIDSVVLLDNNGREIDAV